jgi:hypothetical protein
MPSKKHIRQDKIEQREANRYIKESKYRAPISKRKEKFLDVDEDY